MRSWEKGLCVATHYIQWWGGYPLLISAGNSSITTKTSFLCLAMPCHAMPCHATLLGWRYCWWQMILGINRSVSSITMLLGIGIKYCQAQPKPQLNPSLAEWNKMKARGTISKRRSGPETMWWKQDVKGTQLFIRNVAAGTTWMDLIEVFGIYGTITVIKPSP